jgi:hypothetical protein
MKWFQSRQIDSQMAAPVNAAVKRTLCEVSSGRLRYGGRMQHTETLSRLGRQLLHEHNEPMQKRQTPLGVLESGNIHPDDYRCRLELGLMNGDAVCCEIDFRQ